jgi:hypothetical protein
MSLDGLVLEKLAKWRPDGRQTLEVAAPEVGWAASVTADAADLVGCRLWEVSLRRTGGQEPPAGDLKARAEAVAGRVTGLLEPLQLIEVDASRGVALLRSATPTVRDETPFYYEVLLHAGGAADVRRYEGPHGEGTRRQQVAYTLTHEVLAKLIADLTA